MEPIDDVDFSRLLDLPSAELHVMMALLTLGTRQKQALYCNTTKRALAARTRLSERSVQTHLAALEERDLVRRCGCDGRTTAFWLNPPRRTGTGQNPASAPESFGSSSQVREYLISTNSNSPSPSRGANFAEQGSKERPSRSATNDPPDRQTLPSRSAKTDPAALPPHPPENPDSSGVFSSSEINSAQGSRSTHAGAHARGTRTRDASAHARENRAAAVGESAGAEECESVTLLRAEGFGPSRLDEFRLADVAIVRAAIARANERDPARTWTANRRRGLIVVLLRSAEFAHEVTHDARALTLAQRRDANDEAARRKREDAMLRASRAAIRSANDQRERAAAEERAAVAAIESASADAITAALEAVATDPARRRSLDAMRMRGHDDRSIAKLARFRALVIEQLTPQPPAPGAA